LCSKKSDAHASAAKTNKKYHVWVGLPSTLLPILLSGISPFIKDWKYKDEFNTVGMMVTGVLSAYYNFYGFHDKKQIHDRYSANYGDLVTDIDVTLSRGAKYRGVPDRIIERL
jgi:hypothetical protein